MTDHPDALASGLFFYHAAQIFFLIFEFIKFDFDQFMIAQGLVDLFDRLGRNAVLSDLDHRLHPMRQSSEIFPLGPF